MRTEYANETCELNQVVAPQRDVETDYTPRERMTKELIGFKSST